jgi:dinuclear metal center YbgI/SA1388 family protein
MTTVRQLCDWLQAFAPVEHAAEWDNVGLLLGDPAAQIERVRTCLTVTPEVVAEAVAERVGMIVSHHPILFRGAKQLASNRGDGRIVWPLAQAGVAVYSPHTSFDNAAGGINDSLCKRLGLTGVAPLRTRDGAKQFKVVVYVPVGDLPKLADAMFAAGAGSIGDYRECSFRLPGTGTFYGEEATNPVVGQKGRREEVDEFRFEVVCPERKLVDVLNAMRASHPYEEVAHDIYPLKTIAKGGDGRIGNLPEPMPLGELARLTQQVLSAGPVQYVGDANRVVRKVALACGAAGEFLKDAKSARADVFLTGEARFHDYLSAKQDGIALVLPGHYATERPAVEELAATLQAAFPDLAIRASHAETDPTNWA